MKVELLVSLKVGDGRIIPSGSVFSDKNTPIPEFVMRRLARGMAKIIEHDLPPPPPSITKPEVEKKVEKVIGEPKAPEKVAEVSKAPKKLLIKKSASK